MTYLKGALKQSILVIPTLPIIKEGDMYHFREFYITDHMLDSIQEYVRIGRPVGDFLTAVIKNDLKEAVGRADDENIRNLPAFVSYFYNEAPSNCWGSQEKLDRWIDIGGTDGKEQRIA